MNNFSLLESVTGWEAAQRRIESAIKYAGIAAKPRTAAKRLAVSCLKNKRWGALDTDSRDQILQAAEEILWQRCILSAGETLHDLFLEELTKACAL